MKNYATIIPCYAADTSGVASALYELGGMTVIHDASGCNSTYATHDEPRWVTQQSMIYISALTELDAIMGNDEKFIADVVSAAHDQSPAFIAICGSPMPMMTGFDYDAAAMEIEARSGIQTIALHTNGTRSYLDGASQALLAIVQRFCRPCEKQPGAGINILGATPLDLGLSGTVESIRSWLSASGFFVVSCLAMGDSLETVSRAASACTSLVISQSGLAAAQYLYQTFGIPYVCGVPVGALADDLAAALRTAAETGRPAFPCTERAADPRICVIGEAIYAGSVAAALTRAGHAASVICPLDHDPALLSPTDLACEAEQDIRSALADMQPELVVSDPLYRFIFPEHTPLLPVPHFAFSGRCFDKAIPDLIGKRFDDYIKGAFPC